MNQIAENTQENKIEVILISSQEDFGSRSKGVCMGNKSAGLKEFFQILGWRKGKDKIFKIKSEQSPEKTCRCSKEYHVIQNIINKPRITQPTRSSNWPNNRIHQETNDA